MSCDAFIVFSLDAPDTPANRSLFEHLAFGDVGAGEVIEHDGTISLEGERDATWFDNEMERLSKELRLAEISGNAASGISGHIVYTSIDDGGCHIDLEYEDGKCLVWSEPSYLVCDRPTSPIFGNARIPESIGAVGGGHLGRPEDKLAVVSMVADALAVADPARYLNDKEQFRYLESPSGTHSYVVLGGVACDVTGNSPAAIVKAMAQLSLGELDRLPILPAAKAQAICSSPKELASAAQAAIDAANTSVAKVPNVPKL